MKCQQKGLMTQRKSMENNIEIFWNWFTLNKELLSPEVVTEEQIDVLDSKIQSMGDFSWEIGYDENEGKNFLVISPEGDKDMLEKTYEIINLAPKNINWVFYPFKQPKKWELIFDLFIEDEEVRFDAKNWEYILYKYPDNVYDIIIKMPEEFDTYKDYLYNAAIIALEGELGEEFVINRINEIEIVQSFNKEEEFKKRNFIDLKSQVEKNLLK